MKTLFVYTDIGVRGRARSYNFGVATLSAVLKARGHATKLHYLFGRYNSAPLKQMIADYQPDIIAFTATSPQYIFAKRLINDLQPLRAFTILGGPHATLEPECLQRTEGLNAVCVGEGEGPLLELAEALQAKQSIEHIPNLWIKQNNGQIIRNETRPFIGDLDLLPFPDRDIFDYQRIIDSDFHTALFMFSRGCPYNCTFCSNHALRLKQTGNYVRFRSVAGCLEEIRTVLAQYKVKTLYFNDDCFIARSGFVEEFCELYKRNFTLPFDINARPETLNEETCRLLKHAGCRRVSIGIESGSEKFRKEVLGRRQSNDSIVSAFEACRKIGLKTKSFNIVGFPFETPDLFQETVELNARINPDSVILGVYEPYPGTKLADICQQEHFIENNDMDNCFRNRQDTALKMPQFSRREILTCFRNFGYNVYRKHSLLKAIAYKIYYAPFGQFVLRLMAPVKNGLRKLVMRV